MPVLAADVGYYCSLLMPEDDVSPSGGGIDVTSMFAPFTELDVTGQLEIVSSNVADTAQTATLTYRDSAGVIQTNAKTMNGTTAVAFTPTNVERVLKIVLSAAAVGIVTLQKFGAGTVQVAMAAGVTTARRLFYDSSAEAAGGAQRDYYDKVFIKNEHASLAVTVAQILQGADPSGNVTFAVALAKDDTVQTANRLTAPPTITFDDTPKAVPTNQVGAAEAIAVWLKFTLAAGAAAAKTSYTPQLTGKSA